MNKQFVVLALGLCGLAYFCAPVPTMRTPSNGYQLHTPEQFQEMLKASPIQYEVQDNASRQETNFSPAFRAVPEPVDPCLRVQEDTAGVKVWRAEPAETLKAIFKEAFEELHLQNGEKALALYKKALEHDRQQVKCWTYTGNLLYSMGRYQEAQPYLVKAVELAPAGYQEHLFLAQNHLKSGNRTAALEHITYAYMLNKNDSMVQSTLYEILDINGLALRQKRLVFPVIIQKVSNTRCIIWIPVPERQQWMALANCMAAWEMEPTLRQIDSVYQAEGKPNLVKYREYIYNLAQGIKEQVTQGGQVTEQGRLVWEACRDQLGPALLYWEIYASYRPETILHLTAAERGKIVNYIKKYVYIKRKIL